MRIAMIAITTNNSISVNAVRGRVGRDLMFGPSEADVRGMNGNDYTHSRVKTARSPVTRFRNSDPVWPPLPEATGLKSGERPSQTQEDSASLECESWPALRFVVNLRQIGIK